MGQTMSDCRQILQQFLERDDALLIPWSQYPNSGGLAWNHTIRVCRFRALVQCGASCIRVALQERAGRNVYRLANHYGGNDLANAAAILRAAWGRSICSRRFTRKCGRRDYSNDNDNRNQLIKHLILANRYYGSEPSLANALCLVLMSRPPRA